MILNPSEISELIKENIKNYNVAPIVKNVGKIVSLADGIVRIHGLETVQYGERLEFEGKHFGIALNLERDSVGAVVLGSTEDLAEGQKVWCTGEILKVPVGEALLGRVVDALGRPIDDRGAIDASDMSPIEKVAPG
ncbi:MAG: F0F1 ATP synthase subunit alpha, partial [Gammaproteobacteria bacterium]|nr:F0F1 ATP synthase subunit alpha [Gammaproteobacteria bacterium]